MVPPALPAAPPAPSLLAAPAPTPRAWDVPATVVLPGGLLAALLISAQNLFQPFVWRPFTAIRNGDQDGNDATERDAGWLPLIETPMHPEYPCAHCTIAASLGALLKVEIGSGPTPRLSASSPTLPGVTRSWGSVDAFTQEVVMARIYDGVHYRSSGEVGNALGIKVGELAAAKLLR